MIEYDYLIERDEGDETKEFKPDKIPTKLDNLSYIEGPNSSGKSTLLNIIALGFYGLKNSRINVALQDKLKSLSNSTHQKLSFKIKISSKNADLEITSEKSELGKPEIVVKEITSKGERKLTKEMFEREYNLIYDIPDNPTQRLNQLILDIKDAQIRYGNNIGTLKETVRRIITEIKSARDPERIQLLERQLKEKEDELNLSVKTIENYEDLLNILENYTYHRFYTEYGNKVAKINQEIELLRKKVSSTGRKTNRENSEYYQNLDLAKISIQNMQAIFDKVSDLLNVVLTKDRHYLNIWQKIDLRKALEELRFDDELEECILHFKKVLVEQEDELKQDDSTKEADLYNDLISVLENYKRFNLAIPGLDKSISEFIGDLKTAAEKHEVIVKKRQNIQETDAELARLKKEMERLTTAIFPDMIKLRPLIGSKTSDNIIETAEDQISGLNEDLQNYQGKFELYESRYKAKGKPSEKDILSKGGKKLKDFLLYTEEQLREKIRDLEKSINEERANSKTVEHTKISISSELERLRLKKPHQYQNKVEILNELWNKLNLLDAKFKTEYDLFIKQIIDQELPKNISKEQSRYNDVIFHFLATKIGRFTHIRTEYKAIKVDLIERIIYTDNKKKIHLDDMGTGQGQSAYLKGLLNTSDKRKIIAMFDEVAMMDTKSLEPIYKRFKELYEQGKLLVGIVVQRGEEVNVLSKMK
jgi:exonuclease SbcC